MKREQKSLTNKGFSLVELIIVVAIMAVLIGVLAPQYLRYVEKTRLQKDNTNIADFANVIKIACAEEEVNSKITAEKTFEFDTDTGVLQACGLKELDNELALTVNATKSGSVVSEYPDMVLTSSAYATAKPKIIVSLNSAKVVTVKCVGWVEKPGASPLTASNPKTF